MLNDDYLADQQLRQEDLGIDTLQTPEIPAAKTPMDASDAKDTNPQQQLSGDDSRTIVNELSLGNPPKLASADISPGKRKRRETAATEDSPKKQRLGRSGPTETKEREFTPPIAKGASGKLSRPKPKALKQVRSFSKAVAEKEPEEFLEVPPDDGPEKQNAVPAPVAKRRGRPKGKPRLHATDKGAPKAATSESAITRLNNGTTISLRPAKKQSLRPTDQGKNQDGSIENAHVYSTKEPDAQKAKKHGKRTNNSPTSTPMKANMGSKRGQLIQSSIEADKQLPGKSPQSYVDSGQEESPTGTDNSGGMEDEVEDEDGSEGDEENAESSENDGDVNGISPFPMEKAHSPSGLELYGQEAAWEKILEGAHSASSTKMGKQFKPEHRTRTIKTMISDIREAGWLLIKAASPEVSDQPTLDRLNEQLRDAIDAIEHRIRSLSEKNAHNKESEIIKDMYVCAIPAMIFLLELALIRHASEPFEECGLGALEEVLHIQYITHLLCEKCKGWKARPLSTQPIIRPIKSMVAPNLREMLKIFSDELKRQKIAEKRKQNTARFNRSQEDCPQDSQRHRDDYAKARRGDPGRIIEGIRREGFRNSGKSPPIGRRGHDRNKSAEPRNINGRPKYKMTWTNEEELELIKELMTGDSRHLAGV
ncbi:hypothetical protein MMC28_001129 [Mycoblastus sanguinarius]|nr:hypothetical protein [Mycoblastus sanguinarius]